MAAPGPETTLRLARRQREQGHDALAMALLRPLLSHDHAALHFEYALAARNSGEFDTAAAGFRRVTALKPDLMEGWANLAAMLRRLQDYSGAETALDTALSLIPDHPELLFNRGNLALDVGDFEQARACYQATLDQDSTHIRARQNLGQAHRELGETDRAEACWRALLAEDNTRADTRLALAYLLLSRREFAEGFALLEARREVPELMPCRFDLPHWQGDIAALPGTRLLVVFEQGLGDAIMLSRYLPLLSDWGAVLDVLAPKPVVPLIKRVVPKADVSARLSPAGTPEMQVLSFSLPLLCHKAGADWIIPPADLRLPPDPADPWTGAPAATGGMKIGLAWQGNPAHRNDANRSIAPELLLRPLLDLDGVNWVACSVEGDVPEGVCSFQGHLPDLGRSARLAAHLDLVITVDTVWAHLAPGTGTPTWVLLPKTGQDWRWFGAASPDPQSSSQSSPQTSPWYPNLTLWTQSAPGDWAELLARVKRQLQCHGLPAKTGKPF